MPIATALPKNNVTIRFPSQAEPGSQEESYQLLELPPEILKRIEASTSPFPLTIKGRPSDDGVLCTPDSTFFLRTVQISNSLVILRAPVLSTPPSTPPPSSFSKTTPDVGRRHSTLEIRDVCHEILECVPQAANLERIRTILRPSQWEGLGKRKWKRSVSVEGRDGRARKWTRAQLESVIQASEVELEVGLRDRNVVELEGRMVLLPSKELVPLLSLLFTHLMIHGETDDTDNAKSRIKPIFDALSIDHDIPPDLARAVMSLFGEVKGEEWKPDAKRMVEVLGKGLLAGLRSEGKDLDLFLREWKEQIGEIWENLVDLKLLEGEFLLDSPLSSAIAKNSSSIIPFPAHTLPLHPPTRFADLFLTRPRWRPDDMAPFLRGLTRDGDTKERDKLLSKFVRVVKEKEGIWWYPRRTN